MLKMLGAGREGRLGGPFFLVGAHKVNKDDEVKTSLHGPRNLFLNQN